MYWFHGGTPSALPSKAMITTSTGKVIVIGTYAAQRARTRMVWPRAAVIGTCIPVTPLFKSLGLTGAADGFQKRVSLCFPPLREIQAGAGKIIRVVVIEGKKAPPPGFCWKLSLVPGMAPFAGKVVWSPGRTIMPQGVDVVDHPEGLDVVLDGHGLGVGLKDSGRVRGHAADSS